MDLRSLRENRRHGSPDFPVGVYRMQREAGDSILDNHWHAEAEFLAVDSGKAVFQIGASLFMVYPGDVLYISCGELHGAYPLDGSACSYSAVVLDLDWLAAGQDGVSSKWIEPLQRGEITLPMYGSRDQQWARAAYRQITQLASLEGSDHPAMELRMKGGLHLLLADFVDSGLVGRREPWESPNPGTPERLKQVLTYIEQHFARKLTVTELAGLAGMSDGHFSRVFKTYLRKTPVDYINRFRLRYAAERLRQPGVSVAEAAMECGFDNFSYFSKMFRSVYHCTPSAYRLQW